MLKLMLWVNWRQVDWEGIIKESRICVGALQSGLCSVSLAGTTKSPFRLRKEPQSNAGVRAGASPVHEAGKPCAFKRCQHGLGRGLPARVGLSA